MSYCISQNKRSLAIVAKTVMTQLKVWRRARHSAISQTRFVNGSFCSKSFVVESRSAISQTSSCKGAMQTYGGLQRFCARVSGVEDLSAPMHNTIFFSDGNLLNFYLCNLKLKDSGQKLFSHHNSLHGTLEIYPKQQRCTQPQS